MQLVFEQNPSAIPWGYQNLSYFSLECFVAPTLELLVAATNYKNSVAVGGPTLGRALKTLKAASLSGYLFSNLVPLRNPYQDDERWVAGRNAAPPERPSQTRSHTSPRQENAPIGYGWWNGTSALVASCCLPGPTNRHTCITC